jgi:hypothetical protein
MFFIQIIYRFFNMNLTFNDSIQNKELNIINTADTAWILVNIYWPGNQFVRQRQLTPFGVF